MMIGLLFTRGRFRDSFYYRAKGIARENVRQAFE